MNLFKAVIPKPIWNRMRSAYKWIIGKHASELRYWKTRRKAEGRGLKNDFYQPLMLAIASEVDSTFLADKVVADFGCGPRGSLAWAKQARERIGIDVLADDYAREFDLSHHEMRYVNSTEETIPLPDGYCDILYTVNSLDHVKNFECMCRELLRILKPGGEFIASINLGEPPTACEPLCLTEDIVHTNFLKYLNVQSYRLAAKGPPENLYKYLLDGGPLLDKLPEGQEGFLWVRATKPRE